MVNNHTTVDSAVYALARAFVEDGFKGLSAEKQLAHTEDLAREIQRAIEDYFEFIPDDDDV